MARDRRYEYHRHMRRIEREYDMPAVDVIRWEAYTGNYTLRRVARDLGLSDEMVKRVLADNGLEWNREKRVEPKGHATHYAMHVVGE